MAAQAEVRDDWEKLEAYGAAVPEVWLQAIFDGPNLVALLTDPDAHRDRLVALVEHPDRLTVKSAPYSQREIRQISDDVFAMVGRDSGRWSSAGPTLGGLQISLRANETALAETLHLRFGDALEIKLGPHPFPLPTAFLTLPRPAPTSTIDLPNVALRAELDHATLKPGHHILGRVHIRNTSATERLRLETGSPAIGVTLHLDGTRAGGFNGAVAGIGRTIDLAPGDEGSIGFIAGRDTIDPIQGATLPPGRYQLVVPIVIYTEGRRDLLVTPPTEVTLES